MSDTLRDKELKGIEFETNNCNLVINVHLMLSVVD